MGSSIWVRNMEQEEKYLGGFYSALQLALGRWQVGLGIYFTDRRLFLVQRDRLKLDKIVSGAGSGNLVSANLSNDQKEAIIRELMQHVELEIWKHEISQFEIKKPPGIFRTGHINIISTSGKK